MCRPLLPHNEHLWSRRTAPSSLRRVDIFQQHLLHVPEHGSEDKERVGVRNSESHKTATERRNTRLQRGGMEDRHIKKRDTLGKRQ